MGKKKKRGAQTTKAAKTNTSTAGKLQHNPFAASLRSRKRDLSAQARREEEARQEEARQRHKKMQQAKEDKRVVLGQEAFVKGEDVQMTEEEMFSAAVDGLDAIQISRGKYGGAGPVASHVQVQEPKPEVEENPYAREERLFATQFDWDDVEKIEHNLYVPEPPTREEIDALYRFKQEDHSKPGKREAAIEAVLNPGKMSLDAAQTRLLSNAKLSRRDGGQREISIRNLGRDAALQMLEVSLRRCKEEGQRHLRVITGKGLQSAGDPVLKRALVEWCMTLDITYAPEILANGSFGSFILRVPKDKSAKAKDN